MPLAVGVREVPARAVQVLVLTDTDSYVKSGAALAGAMPQAWSVELVIAHSAARPSREQIDDALAGSRLAGARPRTVSLQELRRRLHEDSSDVLVLAARGYTVEAAMSVVENTPERPVIVTGLPGVGVPVLPNGVGFRRAADVFVVYSRRELREFEHAARRLGLTPRFELARLPYLKPQRRQDARGPSRTGPIVFAAQALVPATRAERKTLLDGLVAAARANPDRDVILKVRARPGEAQAHHEQVPYSALVEELPDRPANLHVKTGPMHEALDGAAVLVTVSSTALLEAIAVDIPVLAITDFGIGVSQINLVLEDSGLLGDLDDLVAGRFGAADPGWLEDNYFHAAEDDTWLMRVTGLLQRRAQEGLPAYAATNGLIDRRVRQLMYRHFAFSDASGGGLSGLAERVVVRTALWLNQRRSPMMRTVRRSPRSARAQEFARENAAEVGTHR